MPGLLRHQYAGLIRGRRCRHALYTAGLIEIANAHMPRSHPRSYRILIDSATAAKSGVPAGMPEPGEVERLFRDQSALFNAVMEMMSDFEVQDADAEKHAEAEAEHELGPENGDAA